MMHRTHDQVATHHPELSVLALRVGPEAAALLEFILDDAQLEWADLDRSPWHASATVRVAEDAIGDVLLALRQRPGAHLIELTMFERAKGSAAQRVIYRSAAAQRL
jgi:hypothetical protein